MLKHRHLIIRAEVQNTPDKNSLQYMNNWFAKLIQDIDMKILNGPHLLYCEMPGNQGFTGVCIIETSHIALHTWDENDPKIIQLDVYSCSDVDIEIVINSIKEFSPSKINYVFFDRDDQIKILEEREYIYE